MNVVNGVAADVVSVQDRGLAYGDGVFRTLVMRDGRAFAWQRHLKKLSSDCAALRIACADRAELERDLAQIAAVEPTCVIKIIVTREAGRRGYAFAQGADGTATRIVQSSPPPAPLTCTNNSGIKLHVCSIRVASQPALAGVKHLNRLENVLGRAEWQDSTIAEGLMLDAAGHVIGGTMSNLFLVERDALVTPSLSTSGVAGVQRERVLEYARREAIEVEVADISLERVLHADALFVVNSVIGLWPVAVLAQRTWQPAPLVGRIAEALAHDEGL